MIFFLLRFDFPCWNPREIHNCTPVVYNLKGGLLRDVQSGKSSTMFYSRALMQAPKCTSVDKQWIKTDDISSTFLRTPSKPLGFEYTRNTVSEHFRSAMKHQNHCKENTVQLNINGISTWTKRSYLEVCKTYIIAKHTLSPFNSYPPN